MLQLLSNMFFSRDKEKNEEVPVEFLHKPRSQRKKRQINEKFTRKESLHTTESIISEKVKKYLYKLFRGSGFTGILESPIESSRSTSIYQRPKESKNSKFSVEPARKLSTPEKKYHSSKKQDREAKKLSHSFRKSLVQRKLQKNNIESLNNLYNANSNYTSSYGSDLKFQRKIKFLETKIESTASETSKIILKDLKSNSFCEVVDKLIKKQKKKQPRNTKTCRKKLKKTTKSSISTMCERAKLLLNDSFVEETSSLDIKSIEDREEILTIHDLNNYDSLKSSEESLKIKNKSLESLDIYSKCAKYKCSGKISSCSNIHHSSRLYRPFCYQDFETDLEIWTTDYINGLVTSNEPKCEVPRLSKIPVKKKCKSVKTKSKKTIKSDVNKSSRDDGRFLRDLGGNSHLLGGVKTMEGPPKFSQKQNESQKIKTTSRKDDLYMCQKVQDIQNYIDNLMFPGDETRHQKTQKCMEVCEPGLPKSAQKTNTICPQKQSIQELKKFQRELKLRIKELEKKMPSTSSAFAKHTNTISFNHELSFKNMSHFFDGDGKIPKLLNNCAKKNINNSKMKFGDQFCGCCFLDVRKFPNDICRRCNKKVYLVERICAGDGVYHNFCYTCYSCKRCLNSLNLCVTRGEIFCKQCFQKYFGIEMYGFIK